MRTFDIETFEKAPEYLLYFSEFNEARDAFYNNADGQCYNCITYPHS